MLEATVEVNAHSRVLSEPTRDISGVLCRRGETYCKTSELEYDRKYNTVDPDGADIGPTLQYTNRVSTFHHTT